MKTESLFMELLAYYSSCVFVTDVDGEEVLSLYSIEQENLGGNPLRIVKSLRLYAEPELHELAREQWEISNNFFTDVVEQFAFKKDDYLAFKRLLIDWYAAARTIVELSKSNNLVSSDKCDDMMKSFNFPYPDYFNTLETKKSFLYDLMDMYKIKGSPELVPILMKYLNIIDFLVVEFWLVEKSGNLYFSGRSMSFDESILRDCVEFPYEVFQRLVDDNRWKLTSDDIIRINSREYPSVKLPSMTPYFGVVSERNVEKLIASVIVLHSHVKFLLSLDPDNPAVQEFNVLEFDGVPCNILDIFLVYFYIYRKYISGDDQ